MPPSDNGSETTATCVRDRLGRATDLCGEEHPVPKHRVSRQDADDLISKIRGATQYGAAPESDAV